MSIRPSFITSEAAKNALQGPNSKVHAIHGNSQRRRAAKKYIFRVVTTLGKALGKEPDFLDMDEEVYSALLPAFQQSVLNDNYPFTFINKMNQCLEPYSAYESVQHNRCTLTAFLPERTLESVVFDRYRDFFDQEDVSSPEEITLHAITTLLEVGENDKDLDQLFIELSDGVE